MREAWEKHPPVGWLVEAYLGYKQPQGEKEVNKTILSVAEFHKKFHKPSPMESLEEARPLPVGEAAANTRAMFEKLLEAGR